MADEYRIGKDLEGSSHGLSEVLFWNLPGSTEEKPHAMPVSDLRFSWL